MASESSVEKKQLFISYSRADTTNVDQIISRLEETGHSIWIDREGIRGGDKWRRQIVDAIEDSDFFLLLLSPNSVKSKYVQQELDCADGRSKTILPILIHPTVIPREMELQLAGWQQIDLSDESPPKIEKVLEIIDTGIQEPERTRRIENLENQILEMTKGITKLSFTYAGRIDNFFVEYLGTDQRQVPFGGRQEELRELDKWLNDEDAPPYGLIVAEAGRGKSALLTRWASTVVERDLADVIFIPISIRFDTAKAGVCFTSLAARLGEIYGEPVAFADLSAQQWREVCLSYLKREPPDGKQLLIIMDGLDEASDWTPDANLFPLDPPKRLRVIVSARYHAGDVDEFGWLRRLNWESAKLTHSFQLPALTLQGVQDVFAAMGHPLNELSTKVDIVGELHRLSEGDPLLVRLYVDALLDKGDQAKFAKPENLTDTPKGLDGYFERWWEEQRKLWGKQSPLRERTFQTIFNLLACALGPLFGEDILAMVSPEDDVSTWTLRDDLENVGRFVIGDGKQQGFIFSHPRLGQYFYEQLSREERAEWEKRFIDYGKRTLDDLLQKLIQPKDTSIYCIQNYGAHLERLGTSDHELFKLVSKDWLQAWFELEGMYSGFLNDVERAWNQAIKIFLDGNGDKVEALVWQIKCGLYKSSVAALSANINPVLLVLAVQEKLINPTQALVMVKRNPSSDNKVKAISALASKIPTDLMREVLFIAQTMEFEWSRAKALRELAPHLPEELLGEALQSAQSINEEGHRANALSGLVQYLPDGLLRDAVQALQVMDDEWIRMFALSEISPHLLGEQREEALGEALQAALAIKDNWTRVYALSEMVPHLEKKQREAVLEEALQTAQEIKDDWSRVDALHVIIPHLPQKKREALTKKALQVAQTIEIEVSRVDAISKIASYLPQGQRDAVVREALQAAQAIDEEWRRAFALEDLAPHLTEGLLGEALQVARSINYEWGRTRALRGLAPQLPERLLEEVLQAVQTLKDEGERAEALVELAPRLSEDLLAEALQAASAIENEGDRAKSLGGLAPHLPQRLLREALQTAQAIEKGECKAYALSEIALKLSEGQREEIVREALQAAQAIDDKASWAEALKEIISHLPEGLLHEALLTAQSIEDNENRASALGELAKRLQKRQRKSVAREALQAAQAIKNESRRASVLSELASQFSERMLIEDALQTAKDIKHEWSKVDALNGLIPHLPEEMLREVLQAVQTIEGKWARARALSEIVPRLSEEQREKVMEEELRVAQTIEDNSMQAKVLCEISPYLPEEVRDDVIKEAFQAALDIEKDWNRAITLLELAPFLPEGKREIVIREVFQFDMIIEDAEVWANVLIELTTHLPEGKREVVLKEAFQAIQFIEIESNRVYSLNRLVPYLPKELLIKSLYAAKAIKDEWSRAEALTGLTPYLPEDQKEAIVREALQAALTIEYEGFRVDTLRKLLPILVNLLSDEKKIVIQILKSLSCYPRADYIKDLYILMPFIRAYVSDNEAEQLISKIWVEISEIRQWWS